MSEFDLLDAETIRSGRATDAYFERTERALRGADRNPTVVAEVTLDQFPTGEFDVVAGVEDVAHLLAGRDLDADAIREGRLFDGGPVVRIEGPYLSFARLETAILGFLSEASAYATRALRARRAAPGATVVSFGARHVHPAVGPVLERATLVGGFDGFSQVAAGDHLDREATGTMPHSLVLCFGPGEQEAAWRAYDRASPEGAPRVALCDTFTDETDEALRAAATLGDRLDGVRLDTTASRRGDFRAIAREVRYRLDAAGHEDVDLFASGGITPDAMRRLHEVVDGFGVGSWVTSAPPLEFGLDLVVVDGEPVAKRGKLPGRKEVYRGPDGHHLVRRADEPAPEGATRLLDPLVRDGEVVREFDVEAAAGRAEADADAVEWG
jgi:nicotinate phosphoribosyltransferase